MRKVLTISLPEHLYEIVEEEIKSKTFKGHSEFFQMLVNHWEKHGCCQKTIRQLALLNARVRKFQWKVSMAGSGYSGR